MIFKAIEAIELPIINKLKFLQLQRHDARLEFLISALSQKTDNLKNLIDIEDKVRQ